MKLSVLLVAPLLVYVSVGCQEESFNVEDVPDGSRMSLTGLVQEAGDLQSEWADQSRLLLLGLIVEKGIYGTSQYLQALQRRAASAAESEGYVALQRELSAFHRVEAESIRAWIMDAISRKGQIRRSEFILLAHRSGYAERRSYLEWMTKELGKPRAVVIGRLLEDTVDSPMSGGTDCKLAYGQWIDTLVSYTGEHYDVVPAVPFKYVQGHSPAEYSDHRESVLALVAELIKPWKPR